MTEQPQRRVEHAESGAAPEADRDIGTDPKHPHPQDRPVDDTPTEARDEEPDEPTDRRNDNSTLERSAGTGADRDPIDGAAEPNEPG